MLSPSIFSTQVLAEAPSSELDLKTVFLAVAVVAFIAVTWKLITLHRKLGSVENSAHVAIEKATAVLQRKVETLEAQCRDLRNNDISKLHHRLENMQTEWTEHREGDFGSLHRRVETLETTPPMPIMSTAVNGHGREAIPPHTVATISAAIHTTLRARYRLVSIGHASSDRQAWSVEGRRQVFSSHKVR
ncbi:MAG: hypothetical protein QM715_15445 [Nibricoccus sp.]